MQRYWLIAIHFELTDQFLDAKGNQNVMRKLENQIKGYLRPVIDQYCPRSLIVLRGNKLLIFVHFEKLPERDQAREKAKSTAAALRDIILQEFTGIRISIGIGEFYPSPLDLCKSYREAIQAIDIGDKVYGYGHITAYHELGVYGILGQVNKDIIGGVSLALLERLLQYDSENHTDLVKTLEIYLDEKESFSAAAKRLFVHPNTVKYRIDKVRDILGFDLFEHPEQRLNFHLTLKMRRLLIF
ncbi:CdaR family transcriptional regulator [Carboxydocella sp. ULO1]|uniref:PucR family transcriptional regulator n=1 Tax=Carboxydocella sp. ULO1 TaxID=1926599 RepID=UPI0009AEADA4|nr:helix-turn-helix domain-containing protein [Carboxydocella sp. ULO1]GAW28193.1 PucR family transcriptional regulator [Carboxydocella sp. ULO1]